MFAHPKTISHGSEYVDSRIDDQAKARALNLAYIKLHRARVRVTRQRLHLCVLIFRGDPRHITADMLHKEAQQAKLSVSLATIYNTLNQFTESRLLRKLVIDGGRTYFDTDVSQHHHFFLEEDETVVDIPSDSLMAPSPPEGFKISNVDFVVRLRKEHVTSPSLLEVEPTRDLG